MSTLPRWTVDALQAEAFDVTVTPELAAEWIANAAPNRNPSRHSVDALVADINKSRWAYNGETVKFNEKGEMFDGMHRLQAVVKSGVPVRMLCACNCSEAMVDMGRSKTSADILAIKYLMSNCNDVAATAKLILRYDNTKPKDRLYSASSPAVRKSEVIDRAASDLAIARACALVGHGSAWTGWMPRSAMAFVAYYGQKTSPELIEEFVEECRSGENLQKGHPAYALRSALIHPTRLTRTVKDHALALTAKAWVLRETGQKIALLKYLDSEPFPRFRCDVMGV